MAVGLQIAARIVRVKIEDIRHRPGRGTRPAGRHHASSHSARYTLQESAPRILSLICHAGHLPMASLADPQPPAPTPLLNLEGRGKTFRLPHKKTAGRRIPGG